MSNDLDFDSLMNGHLDKNNNENSGVSRNVNEQSAYSQASLPNTKPEGVNQYLYESEKMTPNAHIYAPNLFYRLLRTLY